MRPEKHHLEDLLLVLDIGALHFGKDEEKASEKQVECSDAHMLGFRVN